MEIVTNNLPQHGVLIHGPESPGFRDRLFALVDVPPEIEDGALRYSIVVENQTPQHILQINLVWRPYPQEGWPLPYYEAFRIASDMARRGDNRAFNSLPFYQGAEVSMDPVFNNLSRSLIKPGEQCPWSLLEGHWFWRQKAVMAKADVRLGEGRDLSKARLAASAKWSVDVDGVLFGDGVFAGPDTALWFDRFETKVRAARDFIAELNRKLGDGEDALAYAEQWASITKEQIDEQCASITKEQIEAIRQTAISNERIYALTRKTTAMNVIARRQKSGEQAAVEWIRASPKSQIPLVRR